MLTFTDLTSEGKKYFAQLKKLANLEVCVGWQAGDSQEDDGTDLVDIAAYNEFGTSKTPARPFMKQSFQNHEEQLQAACDNVNNEISNGSSAEKALNTLGVVCKGLVQAEIVDGGFAPNAESTIKRKGSDTPLVDTGTMRQTVNYIVKAKE